MSKADPTEPFLEQYATACARGSVLELKMRILADNTPAIERAAHARLEVVESAIATHFVGDLSEAERELLNRSRFLRNKVIHGNFSVAKDTLEQLGHDLPEGAVTKFELPAESLTTEGFIEVLGGQSQRVCDTPTKQSTIIGWLMECGTTGVFSAACQTFQRAIEVIERLLSGLKKS